MWVPCMTQKCTVPVCFIFSIIILSRNRNDKKHCLVVKRYTVRKLKIQSGAVLIVNLLRNVHMYEKCSLPIFAFLDAVKLHCVL